MEGLQGKVVISYFINCRPAMLSQLLDSSLCENAFFLWKLSDTHIVHYSFGYYEYINILFKSLSIGLQESDFLDHGIFIPLQNFFLNG
jgi:hypothetical protein